MRKIFILLTTVFVCVLAEKADALEPTEAKEKAKTYAEKIIEQCRSEAYKNNPIGTQDMGRAIVSNRNCLEGQVLKTTNQIFDNEYQNKIPEHLNKISDGYRMYYSHIYNNNKACKPSCGTMFHSFGSAYYVSLLEQMLEDTAFVGFLNDLIK